MLSVATIRGNTLHIMPLLWSYALLDKDKDELIIYGWDNTYYLHRNQDAKQGVTNWTLLVHRVVKQNQSDNWDVLKTN